MNDKGLLKDTSVKVNLNVSDQLRNNLKDLKEHSSNKLSNGIPKPRHVTKKCKYVDTDKYIHAEKLRGKCHNCGVDKLLKKNEQLKRDFD